MLNSGPFGFGMFRPRGLPASLKHRPHEVQAKSLEIFDKRTDDEEDSSSETDLLITIIPLRDLPPIEAAFSIEMVRNLIFGFLAPRDLLKCRLVSTTWLQMATNDQLKKMANITVIENYPKWNSPAVKDCDRIRRFGQLTDLLNGIGSHPFPFSSLTISGTTISQPDVVNLLDCYGHLFKSLNVKFQARENREDFVYQLDSLLATLTKLLTEQMPNLEAFQVEFEAGNDAKFAGSMKKSQEFAGKENQNQNLRVIRFETKTPHEIIDAVCNLAPKLKELMILNTFGFWAKNKHRLHLLKTLHFFPSVKDWDQVKELAGIIVSKEKWELERLRINCKMLYEESDYWPSWARVMKKLIEKSCHSLKDLDLAPCYFLPGTVFPPMPKVKRLCLNYSNELTPEWSHIPLGTSLAITFPNLYTLELNDDEDVDRLFDGVPKNFLSLVRDEEVASIRRVIAHDLKCDAKMFKKRFPNVAEPKSPPLFPFSWTTIFITLTINFIFIFYLVKYQDKSSAKRMNSCLLLTHSTYD